MKEKSGHFLISHLFKCLYILNHATTISLKEIVTIDTLISEPCNKKLLKTTSGELHISYTNFSSMLSLSSSVIYPLDTSFILYQFIDTITVLDNNPPTFNYTPPNDTITCGDFNLANYNAFAQDNCQTDLQLTKTDSSYQDLTGNTIHKIKWLSTDGCGNQSMTSTLVTELHCIDCDGVTIEVTNNELKISKLEAPNANLKLYRLGKDNALQLVASCVAEGCENPQLFSNLSLGEYYLDIKLFSANWQLTCELTQEIKIDSSQISNPCADLKLNTTSNAILINTVEDYILDVKVFNKDWYQIYECVNESCNNPVNIVNIEGLDPGNYNVLTKFYEINADDSWRFICEQLSQIDIPVKADGRNAPKLAFKLFPNPAKEEVIVNLQNYIGETVAIRIQSLMSKELYYQHIKEVSSPQTIIPLKNFTNGMYILSLQVKNRPIIGKKFIVSRLY